MSDRIWYGGRRVTDPEPGDFDSTPGLDNVLWIAPSRTVHRGPCAAGPFAPDAYGHLWSPDVAEPDDIACPTCLPEGLP